MTSMLNLLELYYALIRDSDEKIAEEYFHIFLAFVIPYSEQTVKNAAKFRFANRKKGYSYVDCLGYMMALENGIKFLTGDPHFEGVPNVEFVK